MRQATLFNTRLLHAQVGVYRRRPVIDRASGLRIGTAQRPRWSTPFAAAPGFWLRDVYDRVVIRVIRDWKGLAQRRWTVLGASGEEVGSIVSAVREFAVSGFGTWTGSVLLNNEEAAFIRGGVVVDPATRREFASLSRNVNVWTLAISDRVEGPMRAMVLAWLGVAFDLQRAADASD
jgi:hypothetical protein